MTRGVQGLGLVVGLLAAWPAMLGAGEGPCATCHPDEVEGYSHSAMAHALRRAGREPEESFVHEYSGTKFTVFSDSRGVWQRRERDGAVSEYRVDYVIGSGRHASGYLVRVGRHLFQSPITYYPRVERYDMAPGYEKSRAPDFIRPATIECLLCHSGQPLLIEGTLSEYEAPAFSAEAISCERCHGDPSRHLKEPLGGTIVNPAKLGPAARNSVCEQCHLMGVARVLNPGKKFQDFHPGEPLEETFAIYTAAVQPDRPRREIKVISHSEQLVLSACARASEGRLWCGTCHNPHEPVRDAQSYYRARCLSCHEGTLARTHPGGGLKGDCISCHMGKRDAQDGGHTAFTDHWISRRLEPAPGEDDRRNVELTAWREPPREFRQRNLGLAYVNAGFEHSVASQIVRGLHLLQEVEKAFRDDPAVLRALGNAFLAVRQPRDALRRFERVLELEPASALDEANVGTAWLRSGRLDRAAVHLERAVQMDPLLLPTVEALMEVYGQMGEVEKAAALSERVRQALGSAAPREPVRQRR